MDSSTGAVFIRAPLTIDDDDDDDNSSISESNGHRVVVSDSGYGSYSSISSISGEEFETASERPDPDEEIVEGSGAVDKYRVARPFVADPDEEFSQKSIGSDENDGPVVDFAQNVKPIAQLSIDDDGFEFDDLSGGEEGLVSEGEDGGGVSPVVKVPDIGRVDSALRVKVMESEGEEDEPFSESMSPEKFVDSSVSSKFIGVGDVSVSSSAESIAVNGFAEDSVSAELVEDKGDGVTAESHNESFVDRKGDVFKFVENSIEQGPELRNSVPEKIESEDQDRTQEHSAELSHFEELMVEVEGVNAEEPSDSQNNPHSSFDDSGGVSLDQDSGNDNLESKTEPEIDSGVHLYDPLVFISAESADGTMKGKKIQAVDSHSLEPNSSLQNGDLLGTVEGDGLEDAESSASRSLKSETETDDVIERAEGRQKGLLSNEDIEELIFGSSRTTRQITHGLEERLASSSITESEDFQGHSQRIDGEIVTESDDEPDAKMSGEGNELFDSATLIALLKSATGAASDGGGLPSNRADGSNVFTYQHHAGSGSLFPSFSPGPSINLEGDVTKDKLSDEEKRKIEKIQILRVKFLRLVQRLGHSFDDSVVAQVLYRLALALGGHSSQAFSIEAAKRVAEQHEIEDKDDMDFSLNILVLGKTGVGKSATINSIFGEEKSTINAFEPATSSVKVIAGLVHGVKIRIFDTPGLRSPAIGQTVNKKTLASIRKSIKKFPPDVVLYVDRLDTHTRDHNDLPLLKSLTSSLGSSVWQNAILCLTHAASDPPDGPSGLPLSYEVFVGQQSHAIQQRISQAIGDPHLMNLSMMHPVSLVENHQSCQKNRIGEIVLPNGQSWRPQLLLLCFSLKILSEANSVSKSQGPAPKKFFGFRRPAPLSYFLSSLLQSHTHPKLSADQGGDGVESDVELVDFSGSDLEDEDEYDQLPPFKSQRKSQVAKLSKEQRKAYFEEYDYRVQLLQKKQWKEEVKRLREMKKKGYRSNNDDEREDGNLEDDPPATVPAMLPDFALPPSFDGDSPAYRYRVLEPTSQLLARPVLDSPSWDHDCGFDGVSLERNFVIANQFPGAFAFQITKDKKEFNIHLDSSISAKFAESGSTMAGLDIQTVGRQLAYIFRSETKFRSFKMNKTSGGVSITLLGENVATGLKIEDEIAVGKRLVLSGNAGAVQCRGDTAYGANLELRLKDKDFPIGNNNSSLGLSLMNWRGDLNLMANVQSQFSVGRSSKMAVCIGLNKQRSGQVTVKLSSSEQLQMALIGIVPIALSGFRSICPGSAGQSTS